MIIRHPLPLLTNEVPRIALNQAQTIVLAQDVHRPFADGEAGWLAQRARAKVLTREFDEYFQALALVSPNISRVLTKARELSLQVIFSCLGHRPSTVLSTFQEASGWTWTLDEIESTFPEEWRPQSNEPIFVKPGWGATATPTLTEFLTSSDIRNVILLGTMFEFGIRQTALELADRGLGVLVVADGVVALTQAGEKQCRGKLAHGLTKLRTTAELLDLLDRLPEEGTVLI